MEGFIYACTLGLCFVGTTVDFFTLPEQVRRANARPVGGLLPKLLHSADDQVTTSSALSDPDAVVARYLKAERAADQINPFPASRATPGGFGKRMRVS